MDYKKMLKLLPFFMTLLVIPVSMRLIEVPIPFDVQLHWKGTDIDYDIFSYVKSILLIINSVIIAALLFFTINKNTFTKYKKLKPFMIAISILFLLNLISAFLGGNSIISLGGAPSRYEGMYTFISYFLIFIYACTIDFDKTSEHLIIIYISIFTILCAIVGFSQYNGHDIFLTPFGTKLYIPESLKQFRDSMTASKFSFKNMYIFTTHYNYSSMLMSIMSIFWSVYFICTKEKTYKIIAGVMSVLSILMLLGANARSGIVAVFLAVLILGIIFFKKIFQNKKTSLIVLALFLVLFAIAMNFGMMSRFTSLVNDIKKLAETNKQENYIRSQIPLKDIKTSENTYTIVYNDMTLIFDNQKSSFSDENSKDLKFNTPQKGNIVFKDPKYKNVKVNAQMLKSNEDDSIIMYHTVSIDEKNFIFDITKDVKLVNHMGTAIYPEKAKRIGFKGMEKLGSGRGFIFASTIPIILKSPLIGYGADAFLQVFNQDDIYTKLYVYNNPNELVDKPHNLYLLYAINFGIIGVIAFLFVVVYLVIKAMKKYKNSPLSQDALFIGALAGVIAYMGSGFFNDSCVSVSPIFWTLLGIAVSKIGISEK